ncbi:hypothetical protein FSP39_013227 [Pinctada imbricata]|uniref:DZIP3-like HEPN domain-containing protein n=1 Tax=Pinctada imbricata TaxID=66713 RepID=A0AA88YGB5_PINIB|nr:hypothetical protein FSP39_013227 [Pinctada imbricata]
MTDKMATSTPVDICEEEINYCRYSIGVMKVTPQALRQIFRSRHPDLKTFLSQNKGKCQHLRKIKILTETQWDNLYPSTGSANLDDFDATLLILLLRNLSNVTPPATGWNTDPVPSDTSLGADLLRLRGIRNEHAHCKNMRMTNTEFGKKWSNLTVILARLGGLHFQQDMLYYASRPLEDTDSGRTIKREIEKLRKEFQCRLPENIKERGRRLLEKAAAAQTTFVKTKAFKHLLKCLKTSNVITITGTFGCGKKTLASQLALYFSTRHYVIIPINDCQEMSQCLNLDENQIFIINDPFGTSNLDVNVFVRWTKYHEEISYKLKNSLRSKMIFTCRLQIFKNVISKPSFDILRQNATDISKGVYGLSYRERQSIWRVYGLSYDKPNDIPEFYSPSFPFLFKAVRDGKMKAVTPLDIYKDEIGQCLLNENYSFILHLVLASKNQLTKGEDIIQDSVKDLRIPVPSTYGVLHQTHLNVLEGTFLKETGGVYSFVNDTVYDILAYKSGLLSKGFAIENCSRDFFKNNLTFNTRKQSNSELTLFLHRDDFEKWFERFQFEIRNGCFLDIVCCPEFSDECIQTLVLEKLKGIPPKGITEILKYKEERIQMTEIISPKLSCILQEFPFNKGVTFICAVLIAKYYEHFIVVWKILKKSKQIKCIDLEDIMNAAVISGNVDCLEKIVKTLWKRKHILPFVDLRREYFYKRLFRNLYPICLSCACGHIGLVRHFLQLGFNVNETNKQGKGSLAYAVRFRNEKVVQCLINNGVDINPRDDEGKSPLIMAVRDHAILEMLLVNGANIKVSSHDCENVLMSACGQEEILAVKTILRFCRRNLTIENKHIFINEKKSNGFTALHKACECRDKHTRKTIATLLLMENASPRTFDKSQRSSPLHLAAAYDDSDLASLLLQKGADVNWADNDRVTPLFIASENGFSSIVNVLISHRADCTICRKTDGASPLLIAAERGHPEVVRKLLDNLKDEDDINFVNHQNNTPLLMAALNNHTNVCEVLVENGADVNISNHNGYTPIHVASRNGNAKLVNMFLQKGANIDCQTTENKNTPLHLAAMMGNRRAVKILLARGADMEMKNNELQGLTPLAKATYMKHTEIIDLLIAFRKYGLAFPEFQTMTIQSPQSQASLYSSMSSLNEWDAAAPRRFEQLQGNNSLNEISFLERLPSKRSMAHSSTDSVVCSDKGSIKSTRSLTCLFLP